MHVTLQTDLVASGLCSMLVLEEVEYHTSHPNLREEAKRCASKMLSGRSGYQWPDLEIRVPLKMLQKLGMAV